MNGNRKNHDEEGTEMCEIVPRKGSSGTLLLETLLSGWSSWLLAGFPSLRPWLKSGPE